MVTKKNESKGKSKNTKKIGERYYGGELELPWRFEDFDCPTPMTMPARFFPGVKRLDYRSAIRADVSQVRASCFSDMPRCWYVDAWFDCEKCGKEYCWTAKVQQTWFERFHLWSEAYSKICPECRGKRRELYRLQNRFALESKQAILHGTDLKTKQRVLEMVEEIERLSEEPLTKGILEKRDILKRQIEKFAL